MPDECNCPTEERQESRIPASDKLARKAPIAEDRYEIFRPVDGEVGSSQDNESPKDDRHNTGM